MALSVWSDVKYAIRSLSTKRLFTAVILLTLALGIGSNVAIFSVANAVLFRALPFRHPEDLAFVWNRLPATNVARVGDDTSGTEWGPTRKMGVNTLAFRAGSKLSEVSATATNRILSE